MKLTDFRVLTFDCYGTLIDWESGIWAALQPLIQANDHKISREAALAAYGRIEPEQEHETPDLVYHELLEQVHAKMALGWGIETTPALNRAFGNSIPSWPAFPDSAEALAYLKRHYKLVVLSNVDTESFAGSNPKLGVKFDAVCTAEDIGSYKPDPRNFEYLLEAVGRLGFKKADILHTAQSLYHDHVPAEAAGIARCWISRGREGLGSGATKPVAKMPKLDFRFPTLGAMVEAHKKELSSVSQS
jgi:2-haloacid dehalogenase